MLKHRRTIGLALLLAAAALPAAIYRTELLQIGVKTALARSGWRDVAVVIKSADLQRTALSVRGQIDTPGLKLRITLPEVKVTYTIAGLLTRRVNHIALSQGEVRLVREPQSAQTRAASGVEDVLKAAANYSLPFQQLSINTVVFSDEFRAAGGASSEALRLSLNGTLTPTRLDARVIQDAGGGAELAVSGNPALGTMELRARAAAKDIGAILKHFGMSQAAVTSGKIELAAQAALAAGGTLSYSGRLEATQAALVWGEWQLQPEMALNFRGQWPSLEANYSGVLAFPRLKLGLEALKGRVVLKRDSGGGVRIELRDASAAIFGGRISVAEAVFHSRTSAAKAVIAFERIDLAKLLAYYPQEKLNIEGLVDGTLPLLRDQAGLQLSAGRARARDSGSIKLREVLPEQPGYEELQILTDFKYDVLECELSATPAGDLAVKIHLSGSNPGWQSGHPVKLNVTLTENLPALLRSIRLSRGEGADIVQRPPSR